MAPNGYPGFPGKVGRTREDSEPHWDLPHKAPKGAPNVVIVFMDDMGWSDLGCYGSEIVTPRADALARRGIRLNNYTSHPICSPARAALLTGRNAHSVSTGWLATNNPGFPGYSGEIPLDTPTIAETFRAAGYATVAVGKWHNSPDSISPNSTWPTFRGFDRFYGFLESETGYFFPARILQNNIVAPIDSYPDGYYATDDWTDKAIGFVTDVRNSDPDRPFLLYIANNAVHSPLQAKDEDLAKYRGRYDAGWDQIRAARFERQKALGVIPPDAKLSDRDPEVPTWADLPDDQKQLFARHMEAYAAVLDRADQNVGRIVDLLEQMGELENTIFVLSSDNGGSSSAGPAGMVNFNRRSGGLTPLPVDVDVGRVDIVGTPKATSLYPSGWGQVSNTPFPSYKTYTGGGGRRVSFIISWPDRLKDIGAIRTQFAHVTDVMPTLLELAGVSPLETSHGKAAPPVHGKSFVPLLLDGAGTAARSEQYYECWANRAYYSEGWIAVSLQKKDHPIDFNNWTLHSHAEDFSESTDLARQHPDKLKELVEAFDKAAWANLVYPLDSRTPFQKLSELAPHQRPPASSRRRFLPHGQTIHRGVIQPLIADRSYTISVNLQQNAGDMGVLFAIGDVSGGMVLYIEDDRLHLVYNGFGEYHTLIGLSVVPGKRVVSLEYEAQGRRRGRGRLLIDDGSTTDWTDLSPTMMSGFHEGMDIGIDRRGPVSWDLKDRRGAFCYTGMIRDVIVASGAFAPDAAYGKG
jgi:arylsulfatase A-like enzyme